MDDVTQLAAIAAPLVAVSMFIAGLAFESRKRRFDRLTAMMGDIYDECMRQVSSPFRPRVMFIVSREPLELGLRCHKLHQVMRRRSDRELVRWFTDTAGAAISAPSKADRHRLIADIMDATMIPVTSPGPRWESWRARLRKFVRNHPVPARSDAEKSCWRRVAYRALDRWMGNPATSTIRSKPREGSERVN